MHAAALRDIAVVPSTLVLTDGPLAITLHYLRSAAEHARQRGRIAQEQSDAWFDDILRRHAEGRFFSSVTAFTVRGRKP
jgi:hypothetical protein